MKKEMFETCEMEIRTFADVITTSNNATPKGEYDLSGNWIEFDGSEGNE